MTGLIFFAAWTPAPRVPEGFGGNGKPGRAPTPNSPHHIRNRPWLKRLARKEAA